MRTVHGYIRTADEKVWFWISWWDEEPIDPVELPLAA
jgi:hypothetical protein